MSKKQLSYIKKGNPTKEQIELQDKIDNAIWDFINQMTKIYARNTNDQLKEMMEVLEVDVAFNWDIQKISSIRNHVEKVLDLPDIY